MLKSFSLIKTIKKNWKIVTFLSLILIFALLVLGCYPKIQEGLNDKQIGATSTSAVVSFTSTDKELKLSSGPVKDISGVGSNDAYTISGLKPNSKYTSIKVLDSKKSEKAPAYTGNIITLPNETNIIPPALKICDLNNNHSQYDASGILCAYIKFDAGVDLKGGAQGAGTTTTGFKIDDFEITDRSDPTKPVTLTGKLGVNPDTGKDGWCKVPNLLPGKKYSITVESVCDVKSQAKIVIGGDVNNEQMQKLKSKPSETINLFTAPYAVTNVVAGTPVKSGNNYEVTVTFDTENGPETSYTTSLNCDSKKGITEVPGAMSGKKGSITIKNIKPGSTLTGTINANTQCDKPQKIGDPNVCPTKCIMSIPSNKTYKKNVNDNWQEDTTPPPKPTTFSIKT